ncbi:hypothetical protein RhiirC2_787637 [Rhizophagus irregularis]|uniref:Uncharacterized protein n=1 Tax=Rhizophagus irregularis TaxID=588596 RepID=A0A2N1MP30_9GLOM|nr:hypothetical protein RhiirC2_789017 [Rhizophagus irregularis]PKK64339.1 hypothetical protein RhiirC2_787637 [Rhizophagus irregularis]
MALKISMQQLSSELTGITKRELNLWQKEFERKKFLGILTISQMKINPETQKEYIIACDEFYALFRKSYSEYIGIINLAKIIPPYKEYIYYFPSRWIEIKKYQLR